MSLRIILSAMLVMTLSAAGAQNPEYRKPDPETWYRLVTRYNGTDARVGRCIQYFPEGSAHPGMLWSAVPLPATDPMSDYQYWRFESSADDPDMYAIICKAAPEGYVSAEPSSFTAEGRWFYIATPQTATPDDKYDFELGGIRKGSDAATGESFSDIYTDVVTDQLFRYMNCGDASQDYAINVAKATAPRESNEWLFSFSPRQTVSGVSEVSVDNMETAPADVIYDLYGRVVENPSRGIYI